MSKWAARRQFSYIAVIFLLFATPFAFWAYKTFYHPPTCFDQIKNQDEVGIDCGGTCKLVCTQEALQPVVEWQRYFMVADGLYTAAIQITNPNPGYGAVAVPYVIRLYDESGVAIYVREGVVDIPPSGVVPVVESGLATLERTPLNITFDFTAQPVWQKDTPSVSPVTIRNIKTENPDSRPRITARLEHAGFRPLTAFEVDVVVLGESGNAIAASHTLIDGLGANSETDLVFTWPRPFTEPVASIDIVPKLWPSKVQVR